MTRPAHTRSHRAPTSAWSSTAPAARAGRADRVGQGTEEPAAPAPERVEDPVVQGVRGQIRRRSAGSSRGALSVSARVTQPSLPGKAPVAGPEHLPARAQLVEHRGGVAGDPGRQHQGLQRGGGDAAAPESCSMARIRPSRPAQPAADALPARQERAERAGRHRLHLLAQHGDRASPERPQDLGLAPLHALPAGSELALHDPPGGAKPGERLGGHRHPDARVARRRRRRGRGRACGRSGPPDHPADRVRARERLRESPPEAARRAHRATARRPRWRTSAPRRRPGPG